MEQVKVLVIGTGGSGKTQLIRSLKYESPNEFNRKYIPTISAEITSIKSGNKVFNFWDLAGQDKFAIDEDVYYIGAQLVLATYDMNSGCSLKLLRNQILKVKNQLGAAIPIILVGTKSDLYKDDIPAGLLTTSSKERTGMEEVLSKLNQYV